VEKEVKQDRLYNGVVMRKVDLPLLFLPSYMHNSLCCLGDKDASWLCVIGHLSTMCIKFVEFLGSIVDCFILEFTCIFILPVIYLV